MDKPIIRHRGGFFHWTATLLLAGTLAISGCSSDGEDGAPGQQGDPGAPGEAGAPGTPGLGIKVTDRHGKAVAVQATKGANNPANLCTTVTNASVGTDGKLVVDFDVASSGPDQIPCTADDMPYSGLAANMMSFVVAQLRNGDNPGDSSYWVNYVNSSKTKAAGVGLAPEGTKMNQPGTISGANGGEWTDKGNGSYTFVTNLVLTDGITIADPPKPGTYAYDANLPHRVALQMGDYDGAAGPATHGANNAIYDFIPATGLKVDDPREIVLVQNCNECHGTLSFHGNNGQRLDTKLCVTCHNATAGDPESGNVLDLKVMAHKIHMGRHLPSVGFDFAGESAGLYNNDPAAAIKGTPYAIWGHNNSKHEWSEVGFPANVANCTKCHKDASEGDNWMTKPSKEVCGSCHDGINFEDGTGTRLANISFPGSKITGDPASTGHEGGSHSDNSACGGCHGSTGSPIPVTKAHDVAAKTKTDYDIEITMSKPKNDTHYVAGEEPMVTVVITDKATGSVIDHSDLTNISANLYAYGPRALKKPVLTTAAKGSTGSTAGNSLATDPKVTREATKITYQLDDVAGLQPGTYFVFVRVNKTGTTNTESFKLVEFQVGTATPEPKVAVCTTCHENTMWHDSPGGKGNHPAPFDPDYCGACHDYHAAANAKLGTTGTQWKADGANNMGFGAAPIARRVHGVHFATKANGTPGVNYPFEIYNGHNVSVTFPQDVRNCETCHTAETSGTWATKPSRVACLACHDSDAAVAHGTVMTVDPTPLVDELGTYPGPYSGDEKESCTVCHM